MNSAIDSDSTPKPPPRGQSTQVALLQTARTLITEGSFSDVSISRICEKAGVTKGALYHYFQNKAALFVAVHNDCVGEILADLRAAEAACADGASEPFRSGALAVATSAARDGRLAVVGPAAVGVLGKEWLKSLTEGWPALIRIAEFASAAKRKDGPALARAFTAGLLQLSSDYASGALSIKGLRRAVMAWCAHFDGRPPQCGPDVPLGRAWKKKKKQGK